MSVDVNDAKIIRVDKDTFGGPTYIVALPGETKKTAKARCFRKLKNQPTEHCMNDAGYRTDHPGTGACILHGGATKRPTISTGVHAVKTKRRLEDKISTYLTKSRDELLDLTGQLAATRAIFDEFILAFPDTQAEDYGLWFNRFNSLISTMGTLVEKISRVDTRNTLTAAQVLYLRATMVDVLMKYIPDPDAREHVVKELASRMGGDIAVDLRPSEVSMRTSFVDSSFVDDNIQV